MKNFNEYKIYVFDLDGTLYDQPKLRLTMAKRLMGYYILHPFKIKELLYLQEFRKIKDGWTGSESSRTDLYMDPRIDSVDNNICCFIADKKGIKPEKVTGIIAKWIYDNPLNAIYDSRDTNLISIIEDIRNKGKKVVVLSDYPVESKLKALQIELDGAYSGTDLKIGELKPSPKGLKLIERDYEAEASEIIMIGDRLEKDGLAAQNAGMDYLILPRNIKDRDNIYQDMRV